MKFLIDCPMDTLSGFGGDGVGLVTALESAGHDVHIKPSSVVPPIPKNVAMLLTRWPDPPFDAVIVHLSPAMLKARTMRRTTSRLIAWTMWEYEHFRQGGWEKIRGELESFDLILAYDEVSKAAMVDPAINPGVPVQVLQGGYTPEFWAEVDLRDRDWTGTFRYSMVGKLDRRKNAWGAVRAFRRLKEEHGDDFDAELHLKTTLQGQLPPQLGERYPGIKVFCEWWSHDRLRDFYMETNCLLAPSIGEGKNVPALEAMTTGCPVIATSFGGHTGWLSSEYAYPLDWKPYEWPEGIAALPDEDHLMELMWKVYTDRADARRRGEVASRTIPAMMSWDRVVPKLVDVLSRMEVRA